MGLRDRRVNDEEHENHERWLVTYADMVTLLMVLFIVLYAMSQVDQTKFQALREGLSAGFGQAPSILDGSTAVLKEEGASVNTPITPSEPDANVPKTDQAQVDQAVDDHTRKINERRYAEAAAEATRLRKIEARIHRVLRAKGLEHDVKTAIDDRGLTVSLLSKHVVFEPNLADLTPRGHLIVDTLLPVLQDLTDPLEIDGHTNQVKVKPKYYPTDWELSTARAITVLRYMNERGHIPDHRLMAVGYGHTKPMVDPAQPDSQRVNKRVDIVVLPRVLDEARQLLAQAAHDQAAQRKERS